MLNWSTLSHSTVAWMFCEHTVKKYVKLLDATLSLLLKNVIKFIIWISNDFCIQRII